MTKPQPECRLIDDAGRCWSKCDPLLAAQFGTSLSGRPLADYLVLNLGWIEVSRAPGRLGIRCRPRLASQLALAELFYLLFDADAVRILLSVYGTDWQHSIQRNANAVATLLGSLCGGTPNASQAGRPKLMSRRVLPQSSRLSIGVEAVSRDVVGAQDLAAVALQLDRVFHGRWAICHLEGGSVVLDGVGNGHTRFNPAWHQRATGPSLSRYADAAYADWITAQRQHIARTRETVFDEVDAIVDFPQLGKTRLLYARATFPVTLASGAQFIASGSASDSGIDLRG